MDAAIASDVTSRLWNAVLRYKFLSADEPRFLPAWFGIDEIGRWTLPHHGNGLSEGVAIVAENVFHRLDSEEARRDYYETNRGTHVYESIELRYPDWYSIVCMQLANLARCRVVASAYQSRSGDGGLHRHTDAWHGIIAQVEGEKVWRLGPEGHELSVTMRPGDVLLLPENVPHAVTTPHYSVHVVFALIQSERVNSMTT